MWKLVSTGIRSWFLSPHIQEYKPLNHPVLYFFSVVNLFWLWSIKWGSSTCDFFMKHFIVFTNFHVAWLKIKMTSINLRENIKLTKNTAEEKPILYNPLIKSGSDISITYQKAVFHEFFFNIQLFRFMSLGFEIMKSDNF